MQIKRSPPARLADALSDQAAHHIAPARTLLAAAATIAVPRR